MEAGEAEEHADCGARQHVTQEMHAQDDARAGDQKRCGQKASLQFRIEKSDGHRHAESRNRMPRWKRIAIGRQNFRPAVRFDFARAFAAAGMLKGAKEKNTGYAAAEPAPMAAKRWSPP